MQTETITTRADLELNPNYKLVQTALTRGYTSRKAENMNKAPAVPYNGRYGTGYTTLFPNFSSSQYCYKEYWIKTGDE